MVFTEDTVRLVVQFKDFKGKAIVPDDIKLTIYDTKQVMMEEIVTGIEIEDDSHFYDYVAPDNSFIFEFSGIYNSKPVLARKKITVNFTRGE